MGKKQFGRSHKWVSERVVTPGLPRALCCLPSCSLSTRHTFKTSTFKCWKEMWCFFKFSWNNALIDCPSTYLYITFRARSWLSLKYWVDLCTHWWKPIQSNTEINKIPRVFKSHIIITRSLNLSQVFKSVATWFLTSITTVYPKVDLFSVV